MPAWIWLLAGLALLVAELLTPGGFYVLFFGIGALVVGALGMAGVALSPVAQWLLFPAVSILSLALFRRPLMARFHIPTREQSAAVDTLVGQRGIALADFSAGSYGKVELRGATWSARNVGSRIIARGQECWVSEVRGLELWVSPEPQ